MVDKALKKRPGFRPKSVGEAADNAAELLSKAGEVISDNVVPSPETTTRALMSATPLAKAILPINAAKFAEFLGNDGKVTMNAEELGSDADFLRDIAIKTIEEGKNKFDYETWGFDDKSILMSDLATTAAKSFVDPNYRMATLIGRTGNNNVRVEDGRIVVEDVYDFNSGPRGKKLQKALKLKEKGDIEGYEKLAAESVKDLPYFGQVRVWGAALGVPQGEGTRFKLDLGPAPEGLTNKRKKFAEGGDTSSYRQALTEDQIPPAYRNIYGDRTEKPLSVQLAELGIESTPGIGTAYTVKDIQEELAKEEPNYYKIGAMAGAEAIGLIPGLGDAAQMMIRKGAKEAGSSAVDVASNVPKVAKNEFKNTVKAYKLFTRGEDGKLYPLFVDADTEVPVGQYMKATFPEYRFKAKNGNYYVPSRGTGGKKGTGDSIEIPDQETRDMLIEAGFLKEGSKAKTIKAVAARPGWHAGDNPTAAHIGPEVKIDGKSYKIRGDDQVWAEVEMPADVDWQAIADSRAVMKKDGTPNVKTAHITDELPEGGYYRYKTNPNMQGNWLISGDMKVNRILDRDEVKRINAEAGVEDLPTEAELKEYLGKGFASGGFVGDDMYQGVDDYQMAEMGASFKSSRGYAEGGMAEEVDPVSGNPVPTGSLPEEVRDDIPAQLSEGEYVVPADVVRYYGVKFFEDLRSEAKMGWQSMEANGRVGGEPVAPQGMEMGQDELPFDISELQTIDDGQPEMNAGGYISGYAAGGAVDVEAIGQEFPGTIVGQSSVATGFTGYKTYSDPNTGMTISVRFLNGKPVTAIPPGYTEVTTPQDTAGQQTQQTAQADTTQQQQADRQGPGNSAQRMEQEAQKPWTEQTNEELAAYVDQRTSKLGRGVTALASAINPLVGIGMSAAMKNQDGKVLEELNNRINAIADTEDPTRKQLESTYANLSKRVDKNEDGKPDNIVERSGIFGGESSLTKNLEDSSGNKSVGFEDTWLGDALGFDGSFGVDEGNPGLKESLAGARRGRDTSEDKEEDNDKTET